MSAFATSILAGWPAALYRFLESREIDAASLFKECEVDPELLIDQTSRIPAVNEVMLWHQAARALPDCAHFGLLVPEFLYPNAFYSLSLAMQSAENLRDALGCLIRCIGLVNEAVRFEMIEQEHYSRLRYCLPEGMRQFVAHPEIDATFATLYQQTSEAIRHFPIASQYTLVSQVYLSRPKPFQPEHYEGFFQAEVSFDQAEDELLFANEIMDIPNPAANRELAEQNEQLAQEYIFRTTLDPLIIQAREQLVHYLRHGIPPRQELLAADLHVSLRQLQRKFSESGESYSKLLDSIRHGMACDLLRSSDKSISSIALEIGYSDQSNFTKSFKRWEKLAPADYRKRFRNPA